MKRGTTLDGMSVCPVEVGGVRAEWVEVTPATVEQQTLVYFVRQRDVDDVLPMARPTAGRIAAATGGRVLAVDCGMGGPLRTGAAVKAGLTAYAWLLGEGCDVALTTFVSHWSDNVVVQGILVAAAHRGLPLPAFGPYLAGARPLTASGLPTRTPSLAWR